MKDCIYSIYNKLRLYSKVNSIKIIKISIDSTFIYN